MMDVVALPTSLEEHAERRTWFGHEHIEQVFAWLEESSLPLLGIDAARKLDDGNWELLVDCLDLSSFKEMGATFEQGRRFVAEHAELDFMFEPVW